MKNSNNKENSNERREQKRMGKSCRFLVKLLCLSERKTFPCNQFNDAISAIMASCVMIN
jgi:hypothetical protein